MEHVLAPDVRPPLLGSARDRCRRSDRPEPAVRITYTKVTTGSGRAIARSRTLTSVSPRAAAVGRRSPQRRPARADGRGVPFRPRSTRRMQLVVIAQEPLPGDVEDAALPAVHPRAGRVHRRGRAGRHARRPWPRPRRAGGSWRSTGRPGDWLPRGFDVLAQRNGSLANRLFGAFEDCFSVSPDPVVLIGMDTPQVSPDLLLAADLALGGRADAVMGMAPDGGYWLLGLSHLHPGAFSGRADEQPTTPARPSAAGSRSAATRSGWSTRCRTSTTPTPRWPSPSWCPTRASPGRWPRASRPTNRSDATHPNRRHTRTRDAPNPAKPRTPRNPEPPATPRTGSRIGSQGPGSGYRFGGV